MSGGHLYRVYDDVGLIYIGSTIRLWTRMYEHRRYSWWAPTVVKVRAELVGDEKLMRKLETKAIFDELPRWNVYEQSRLIPSMTPEEFVEYMDRWLTHARKTHTHYREILGEPWSEDRIEQRFHQLLKRWRVYHGENFDVSLLRQVV